MSGLMSHVRRREFLAASSSALGLGGLVAALPPVSARETSLADGVARFADDVEPLVRFLETTPREEVIQQTAQRIKSGLTYRELLAALLLAGVRNVQPRPSVGFKFHAVLVVNSAHLASISGPAEDRWLPILWAIDNFKSSQQRDEREGDWTLAPVDEANVPPAHLARPQLRAALDAWDESSADVAIASMVRHHGANRVFAELSAYAARDFRSIGHKAIYLSNAQRTLQTIGWDYAEPVMRSVVYAMLNHHGEPNPADSDLDADRPGRLNRQRIDQISAAWHDGKQDHVATRDLVQTIHDASAESASEQVVELINRGVSLRSVWDGIFASAGELLMRQPGIVALHSVTTTNAIHYAFRTCGDEATRKFLLLQNASFLPSFREAARGRGGLADRHIDQLAAESSTQSPEIPEIFAAMGQDRSLAAGQIYSFLSRGGDPGSIVDYARRLVFLKGNDSHDYKFSSAALEDYRFLSPQWRSRFLASAAFQLCSPSEPTRPLVRQIRDALG